VGTLTLQFAYFLGQFFIGIIVFPLGIVLSGFVSFIGINIVAPFQSSHDHLSLLLLLATVVIAAGLLLLIGNGAPMIESTGQLIHHGGGCQMTAASSTGRKIGLTGTGTLGQVGNGGC